MNCDFCNIYIAYGCVNVDLIFKREYVLGFSVSFGIVFVSTQQAGFLRLHVRSRYATSLSMSNPHESHMLPVVKPE